MVEGEHQDEDRQGGERHLPPHPLPEPSAGVVDHHPPGRLALHSDAEEGDEHLRRHRRREADRKLDERDVRDVGQDVPEHDPQVRVAERARREDVRPAAVLDRLGPDRAARPHPGGETDAGNHTGEPLADHQRDGEDEEKPRHRGDGGAEPNDDGVGFPPEVPAEQPQHHPERNRDERGEHAHVEGNARPLDESKRHRAAEVVGAEPVLGRRRQVARGGVNAVVLRRHVADLGDTILHLAEHGGGEVDCERRKAKPNRKPQAFPSTAASAPLSSASV